MAVPHEKEEVSNSNEKLELPLEEKIYHRLRMHKNKYPSQIIRCICGAEILLLPDVKEMGRSIESHATEHQKKEQNPDKGKAAFEYIENFLTKQVLEKASLEEK